MRSAGWSSARSERVRGDRALPSDNLFRGVAEPLEPLEAGGRGSAEGGPPDCGGIRRLVDEAKQLAAA